MAMFSSSSSQLVAARRQLMRTLHDFSSGRQMQVRLNELATGMGNMSVIWPGIPEEVCQASRTT